MELSDCLMAHMTVIPDPHLCKQYFIEFNYLNVECSADNMDIIPLNFINELYIFFPQVLL